DAAASAGADRPFERDLADRQRGRGRDGAEDVRIVLLVRRQDGDDDLDVVLVALGEEGPDRAVGQAGGEDRSLRRARLALDEAARDLAGRVHPFLEVDRKREEVEAGPRLGTVGGPEDHGVAEANGDRATRQSGELAGLDGQCLTTELRLERLTHGNDVLLRSCEGGATLGAQAARPIWRLTRFGPGHDRGRRRRKPSGGARAVR